MPPRMTPILPPACGVIGPEQGLLLIEDAVYALLPRTSAVNAMQLLPASIRLFALESDVLARGPWR